MHSDMLVLWGLGFGGLECTSKNNFERTPTRLSIAQRTMSKENDLRHSAALLENRNRNLRPVGTSPPVAKTAHSKPSKPRFTRLANKNGILYEGNNRVVRISYAVTRSWLKFSENHGVIRFPAYFIDFFDVHTVSPNFGISRKPVMIFDVCS